MIFSFLSSVSELGLFLRVSCCRSVGNASPRVHTRGVRWKPTRLELTAENFLYPFGAWSFEGAGAPLGSVAT